MWFFEQICRRLPWRGSVPYVCKPSSFLLNLQFSFLFDTLCAGARTLWNKNSGISWSPWWAQAKHDMAFVSYQTKMEPTSFFFVLSHLISNKHSFFSLHCRLVWRERCVYFLLTSFAIGAHYVSFGKFQIVDDNFYIFAFVRVKMNDVLCVPFRKLQKKKIEKIVRNWTVVIRRRGSFTVGDKAPRYGTLHKSRHHWPRPMRSNLTYLISLIREIRPEREICWSDALCIRVQTEYGMGQ